MEQPTQDEINRVCDWCRDAEAEGESNYPGMTYEQGLLYGIEFMQGVEGDPT